MPYLQPKVLLWSGYIFITFIVLFFFQNQLIKTNVSETFSTIEIPNIQTLNLEDFNSLGIEVEEEYPSGNLHSRIPHIIHQTWRNRTVPSNVAIWMKSWSMYHPTWKYVYWTDESSRCLIRDRYTNLLHMYDAYVDNIRRADAVRYFILFEFGGVYADMDLESLRSLDVIIKKYSCILAQEPHEHPIMDGNFKHLVINAFIACAKRHPFMKLVIGRLHYFNHFWNVLDSTGPHFLTLAYKIYHVRKTMQRSDTDSIYLAPSEYFFPTIDPAKFSYMIDLCKQFDNLNKLRQRACVSLKTQGLRREHYMFSFTIHHWIHSYLGNGYDFSGTLDILDVIPDAKICDCVKGIQL